MLEKQELHCHNCGKYVQFDVDVEMNGNHVIICPECGHEHCRVVKDGIITDDRWDSRNGASIFPTNITVSTNSTFNTYSSVTTSTNNGSASFLYQSWMNSSSTTFTIIS